MKKNTPTCLLLFCFMVVAILSGCISPKTEIEEQKMSAVLNIFNWEDYFGETTIEDFEEKYGVKVNISTFEDEEFMLSALESNPGKYDLAVTSDSVVALLIQTKSLSEIDKRNIPNLKNIDPKFLNLSYDPGNKYSIPYLWGTTGIAINTSAVTKNVTSWSILWDKNYSGKICMLNNKDEVIAVALKYLGYSINTRNLSQLKEAEQLLLNQKSLVQGYYDPITIIENLVSGEVFIAHSYVGEAYTAAEENENITYIIPQEGAPIWVDSFIIPADAPHKYTAEIFINYILDPKVHANITNYQWCATPNAAAMEYVNSEILEDKGIYPPKEILDKCEYFQVLPPEINSEHNRIWAELQR